MALSAMLFISQMGIKFALEHFLHALLKKAVEKRMKFFFVFKLLKKIFWKWWVLIVHKKLY